ncbi:MAG TPA: serine/threonine-protein kinase, partial [Polyangiaceae bacterium]|nr:serine/threonine-protein kinase [Polyangiaceae bacterium]
MSDDEAPPPSLRSIPASSEKLVGTMVDKRYVLKREIGRGGICAVYAAEHRYTRRMYALKALLPEYRKHQEARARLLAEARMLGAVHHVNVVEVIDAGLDDGAPFVVMERLRAKSLEALLLARGKLTVSDTLVIARLGAAGLAATHRASVIHRDIKPGNLLVVRTDTGKTLKLIDFGVATPWERDAPPDDGPPSAVVGTPYYMAPEHLGGQRVTPAADVYSFGATVFECLTGQV